MGTMQQLQGYSEKVKAEFKGKDLLLFHLIAYKYLFADDI